MTELDFCYDIINYNTIINKSIRLTKVYFDPVDKFAFANK